MEDNTNCIITGVKIKLRSILQSKQDDTIFCEMN